MQVIVNILVTASQILLIAVGFSLIFYTARFFHFAHGIIYTAGAYFTFLLCLWIKIPLLLSVLLAILLCAIVGFLIEFTVYKSLRGRKSSELIFLLASLGIYIMLQNVISMVFGDSTKILRTSDVTEGIAFLGARITAIQIISIVASIALVGMLMTFLNTTKIGTSIKAVANDPVLAVISGVSSRTIFIWVFSIGSALAGLAGILVAFDVDMTPTMGMNALMMGVVAVVIGGVNSIPGIALGALLLAVAQNLGTWYIGSQWQDAIAFVIFILFLLFMPKGFSKLFIRTQ
jgi:branched-chain amino acid transport system permease protein